MPFYTFIMEYDGGTYVSQLKAQSKQRACIKWAQQLNISEIHNFGQSSKEKLIEEMKTEEPILLNSLKNVWCQMTWIGGKSALINFVQTDENN